MIREYLRQVRRFSPTARLFLLGQSLAGIGAAAVWVLRNLFLKKAGFEEAFIGQALSFTALGTVVVVLPLTWLMDRRGIKGFLVFGALLLGGGLAGTALWPRPLVVLATSFCTGVGGSILGVSMAPFFMRHSSDDERPYLFGVGNAAAVLSGLIGTLGVQIGAHVLGETFASYRTMMLAGAAIAALSGFVLLAVREAPPLPADGRKIDWSTTRKLCVPELIIGLGAGLTIPFINLYFQGRFHKEAGEIGLYFTFAQAVTFVAFLASPILARRFGKVPTVVSCQLLSIPFFFAMAFTTSVELAVVAFLARHALMNMAQPVSSNFAMEILPPHQRTLTNGIKAMCWNGAWVVSTIAGGWLIDHARFVRDGYTVAMLITIGLYLTGSAIYWFTFRPAA